MRLRLLLFVAALLTATTFGISANAAPTAVNDQFYVVEGYSYEVLDVLNNDTSSINATLTITSTTTPANGTVLISGPGNWVQYTPNPGFSGTDTFNYTVSDGNGTATATVTVNVTPTPAAPALTMLSAPMVSPTNAWTFYGTSTTHTADPSWATTRPEIADLAAAIAPPGGNSFTISAKSFVSDNIKTEFRFGLGKGAIGALIDGSGTPFDQAQLLVYLLRQAGITANYQTGTITLTAQQFGLWTGLVTNLNQANQTFTVSAQAACQFLADGGIPAVINGVVDNGTQNYCNQQVSGNLTTVTMAHVWVQINNSATYDPSFKQYYLKAGMPLATAMGCGTPAAPTCGSVTQSAMMTGATSGTLGSTGAPTVSHLNESAALSQISSYATALESYIKSNNSIAAIEDVVGGPVYTPAILSGPPQSPSVQATWTGDIPDQYRTTATYQFCGQTISTFADVLAGRRIRQGATKQPGVSVGGYYAATTASTFIEDSDVLDCNWSYGATNASSSMTLTVHLPYAASSGSYGTVSSTFNVLDGSDGGPDAQLDLFVQVGEASESTVTYYTDLEQADPTPFHAGSSVGGPMCNGATVVYTYAVYNACMGVSTLNVVQLLSNQSRAIAVVGPVSGAAVRHQARLGYYTSVGGGAPPQIESIAGALSSESYAGDAPTGSAAFEQAAHASSLLEGAIGGDFEPFSGSTTFVLANRSGPQFVDVAPANMSAVIPNLTNYGARTYSLQALANAGYESIIPVNGVVGCFVGSGYTCPTTLSPDYEVQASAVGLLLDESLKGSNAVGGVDPTAQVLATVKTTTEMKTALGQGAAVDMASGQLNLTPPPDIVTGAGSFPESLPFQRYYQSSGSVVEYRDVIGSHPTKPIWSYTGPDSTSYDHLGGGWQHNYQIMASWTTDIPGGLGQYRALDASAFITSAYIGSQLLETPTFDSRMAALFVDYWQAKQLFANALMVKVGPKSSEFTKLPDGTWAPPRGSAAQLIQNGGTLNYTYRINPNGSGVLCEAPYFDYSPFSFTLTNPGGDSIVFNDAGQSASGSAPQVCAYTQGLPVFNASTWTFPNGNVVQFSYTPSTLSNYEGTNITTVNVLNKVSNKFGHSLSFATSVVGQLYIDNQEFGDILNVGWLINSVTDENGRAVTFALPSASCPTFYAGNGTAGASPSVGQAALACNTLNVTTPDGAVWSYGYAPGTDSPDPTTIIRAPYHLRRWFPPSSPSTAYEVAAFGGLYTVAKLTDPLGHVTSYYPEAVFPFQLEKRTGVIDALGNGSNQVFDQWNDLMTSTDPLGRESYFSYDTAQRQILAVSPLQGCVATTYDLRSNVLSKTTYPAGTCTISSWAATLPPNPYPPGALVVTPAVGTTTPSSPPGGISTSTTYNEGAGVYPCVNPVTCNKPATDTDALGHTTSYSWDSTTGNLTQVVQPPDMSGAQPTTTLAYTPLAGSSACSNGATAGGMALVCQKTEKISGSSSLLTTYTYNGSNAYVLATATVDPGGLNLRTCFKFDVYGNLISTSDPRATSCP